MFYILNGPPSKHDWKCESICLKKQWEARGERQAGDISEGLENEHSHAKRRGIG